MAERHGDGFRLRLVPARGAADQTWVVVVIDAPALAPTRLTALPADGPPESVALEPPLDGTGQVLVAAGSALVRTLADPTPDAFLL